VNATAIALVGVIGGILVCMLTFLIAMVWDVKKDLKDKVDKNDCNRIMDKLENVARGNHDQ